MTLTPAHLDIVRARLRLVAAEPDGRAPGSPERAREVVRENRAAARNPELDPADPRLALALRAAAELQGSALTPERRDRVMSAARELGVRPFDANLIVAIAQDHARRGEPIGRARPILAMLARPNALGGRSEASRSRRLAAWLGVLAVLAAATAAAYALARWVSGG